MSLQTTIEVVTKLAERGAIERYAIAGAVAALNYIEPTLTQDLDILVSITHFERRQSGLILFAPIEEALAGMGYTERVDAGYMIDGWPVQFLPVASDLDEEALERAIDVDAGLPGGRPLKVRCLRAEDVVAIAIKLGRLKDLARVQSYRLVNTGFKYSRREGSVYNDAVFLRLPRQKPQLFNRIRINLR